MPMKTLKKVLLAVVIIYVFLLLSPVAGFDVARIVTIFRDTPELVLRIHQIVSMEKPTHTHYYLKFLEEDGDVELREFFVIGARSGIGIGAEVIEPLDGDR